MIAARRAVAVLWPIALLAAFAGTFRRMPAVAHTAAGVSECDRDTRPAASDADPDVLQRCLDLDPANVDLLVQLGSVSESAGRFDYAEALYRRALALDARDGDLHVRLGILLLNRGDREGALGEAHAALRWHPNGAAATELAAAAARPAQMQHGRGVIR